MNMISTPSLLEQFGAAADEKNYFLYMILDQGMGKKPGKVPARSDQPWKNSRTDWAAKDTLHQSVLRRDKHSRPKQVAQFNEWRKAWCEKEGRVFYPILRFEVGFVPRAGSALVVFDLDDCRDPLTGDITDGEIAAILGGFTGYVERSTSGTGLRVLMPREKGDERHSDRGEWGGVGFMAKAEQHKGMALTLCPLSPLFEWERGFVFDPLIARRDGARREVKSKTHHGDTSGLDEVALEFAHISIDDLEQMFARITNDDRFDRDKWIGIGKAVREAFEPRGLGEEAWEVFDTWTASRKGGDYDPVHNRDRWDEPLDGKAKKRTTLATVIKLAQEGGWERRDVIELSPEQEDEWGFLKNLDTEKIGAGKTKKTRAIANYMNAVKVVRHMPKLAGLIGRNVLTGGLVRLREWDFVPLDYPVEWTDIDMHRAIQTIQGCRKEGTPIFSHWRLEQIKQGIEGGAKPVQPVREMIRALSAWDGRPRLDTWLRDYFGVEDTPLHRAYARKFMISLIARGHAMPGNPVKCDTVLVITGAQGLHKSEFFACLAGYEELFTDHVGDIGGKEAQENIGGRWICEFAEGDVVTKTDRKLLKGFMSRRVDKYRPPYGRNVQSFPRACVFVMPTNEEEVLNDPTGSRRYWPVKAERRAPLERLKVERGQLLAEARAAYEEGEPWWLTEDEEELRVAAASEFEIENGYLGQVERVLADVHFGRWISTQQVIDAVFEGRVISAKSAIGKEINEAIGLLKWRKAKNKGRMRWTREKESLPEESLAAIAARESGGNVVLSSGFNTVECGE